MRRVREVALSNPCWILVVEKEVGKRVFAQGKNDICLTDHGGRLPTERWRLRNIPSTPLPGRAF